MASNRSPKPQAAGVHYRVQPAKLHAHLYEVTLTIARPQVQQRLMLPVWIAGSYLVREFSKNLQDLRATQNGRRVDVEQLDKHSWQVRNARDHAPLVLHYQVYALDNSVRTAWLDAQRGFFNGTSLCLQVQGQQNDAHTLEIAPTQATAHWRVATALRALRVDKLGFGLYHAAHYDMLVDSPVELGTFEDLRFEARGVPHRLVLAGSTTNVDLSRLQDDTQTICEAAVDFWHGATPHAQAAKGSAPHDRYVFLLNAVHDGYGGLEHAHSTALITSRKDLPQRPAAAQTANTKTKTPATPTRSEGYVGLLGLISHEYFHTWNVKRLRPTEFAQYDYTQENYTQLLWFFEGFTSYYDDLLLLRAGLIDSAAYLRLLAKTINQVAQTPGRKVQSVAQASFDAWVKYYRVDENTPNATVSYYTKGALVALCLDLTLRHEGHSTLDAVMRTLWTRCQGGPMGEADLLAVLAQLGRRSYASEIRRWVHGTDELPVAPLLQAHGVAVHQDAQPMAQRLGLRVREGAGVFVTHVARDSAAEHAGFATGDEWISVQAQPARGRKRSPSVAPNALAGDTPVWRLLNVEEMALYCGTAQRVQAQVSRDRRVLTLALDIPAPSHTLRLALGNADTAQRWLQAKKP